MNYRVSVACVHVLCLSFCLSLIIMSHFLNNRIFYTNNSTFFKNRIMGEKKHSLSPSDLLCCPHAHQELLPRACECTVINPVSHPVHVIVVVVVPVQLLFGLL